MTGLEGGTLYMGSFLAVVFFIERRSMRRARKEREAKRANAPKCYWCDKKAELYMQGPFYYCYRCGNYGCKEHLNFATPSPYDSERWLCDADWPRFTNGKKRPSHQIWD